MLPTWIKTFPAKALAGFASLSPRPSLGEAIDEEDFSTFFGEFKKFGIAITGICTITSLVFFIIALTKLSASAGNDRARAAALKGVLYSGIALALFGGATVIVGVFWNALK